MNWHGCLNSKGQFPWRVSYYKYIITRCRYLYQRCIHVRPSARSMLAWSFSVSYISYFNDGQFKLVFQWWVWTLTTYDSITSENWNVFHWLRNRTHLLCLLGFTEPEVREFVRIWDSANTRMNAPARELSQTYIFIVHNGFAIGLAQLWFQNACN